MPYRVEYAKGVRGVDFTRLVYYPGNGSVLPPKALMADPGERRFPDKYGKLANEFLAALVKAYDTWSTQVVTPLLNSIQASSQVLQVQQTISARVDGLVEELIGISRTFITKAGDVALGKALKHLRNSDRITGKLVDLMNRSQDNLTNRFAPSLKERLARRLFENLGPGVFPSGSFGEYEHTYAEGPLIEIAFGIEQALTGERFRAAQLAGGSVLAIFEVQSEAMEEENENRSLNNEPPIPVRWVLDPRAKHCADDARGATLGCPGIAGTYPGGIQDLPTTPAGRVTCRGNDRCHLEYDLGSGFEII